MSREIIREFRSVGKALLREGLNSSHSGNLSLRRGNRILITRREAMLGRLRKENLIDVSMEGEEGNEKFASSELPVHRAIYKKTPAKAIVHCHPPHAIALSLHMPRVVPVDVEGSYHLKEVPVLVSQKPVGSRAIAGQIAALMKSNKVILCRGHGSFAVGDGFEEAYWWSSCLEHSSKILWLSLALSHVSPSTKKDLLG